MQVRVIVSGRGYDAAAAFPQTLDVAAAATLDDVLRAVNQRLPAERPLPSSCLIAVSGRHLGSLAQHAAHTVREGDEILLIAPVAGG